MSAKLFSSLFIRASGTCSVVEPEPRGAKIKLPPGATAEIANCGSGLSSDFSRVQCGSVRVQCGSVRVQCGSVGCSVAQ